MNRRRLPCLLVTLAFLSTAAVAESRIEKTLKIDTGGRLEVDTEVGALIVTGASRSDVHVVVTSRGRDLDDILTLRFDEGGKTARITGKKKGHHLFGWSDGDRVRFEIEVPTATALDLETSGGGIRVESIHGDVRLHTSGGAIDVRDLVGDLDGHTSGGGVVVKSIKGKTRVETSGGSIDGADLQGPVTADTSGGGITVRHVTGDLKAHSSGGSIRIEEAGGLVDADTSGGGIRASFARGNSKGGTLESSGGSIELALDPNADLEIDASADRVSSDLPLTVHGEISRGRLHGTLNKGGASLRVHSSGGGIRIERL
jgi:DUF4097 and DUF4098 domain-containing protein YvlB